jgi:GT2 family glycosyltransferase
VDAGANLGFAGGANRGVAEAAAPLVLLLNPDAFPEDGALEALLDGVARHPEAAGVVPSLWGLEGSRPERGAPQHRWQLKPLPGPLRLVLEALFLPAAAGPPAAPPPGARIEQPAAAALALRRADWEAIGGMDEGFRPAWFEDVDLARRLRDTGRTLVYHPAARFRHALGSTVPRLGFRSFLWLYYRNLVRYLGKHHGRGWAAAARALLPVGMALRLALLPLRKPRRATSRAAAARGLLAVAAGALTRWRRPADLAREWAREWPS